MRVFVVTPPEPVVSLADAKRHLRVDGNDEDALIEAMIAAATGHIDGPDGWLGRALGVQILEARTDFSCGSSIRLPFRPVVELVSVSWFDRGNVEQMVDLEDLELLGSDLIAAGTAWPWSGGSTRREAIRIRYRAGYPHDGNVSTLPAPIRAAILLMVGDLYRNRDTTAVGTINKIDMSTTVENLLAPFRVFG